MRRLPMLLAILGILLPVGAAAQPHLVVEPDSIFFDGDGGTPDSVVLANTGSDSLRIDSLQLTDTGSAWYLELALPDTTYKYLDYLAGRLVRDEGFPYAVIASQDTSVIQFNDYDGCPACKKNRVRPHVRDTLTVYTSDANRGPVLVPINVSHTELPVGKPGEPDAFSANVYPNPTSGAGIVLLGLPEGSEVEVHVYDALGRRVATLADGHYTAGRHRLHFEGEGLPSGVYVIRATVRSGSTPARVVTRKVTMVQ